MLPQRHENTTKLQTAAENSHIFLDTNTDRSTVVSDWLISSLRYVEPKLALFRILWHRFVQAIFGTIFSRLTVEHSFKRNSFSTFQCIVAFKQQFLFTPAVFAQHNLAEANFSSCLCLIYFLSLIRNNRKDSSYPPWLRSQAVSDSVIDCCLIVKN